MTLNGTRPHNHVVAFYDHDEDLVATVADFLADGIRANEAVVSIATAEHRWSIEEALALDGIDVRTIDGYTALDAREVLGDFMVNGSPNATWFDDAVGGVLASVGEDGRAVRAFGEMVALLWQDGNVTAAIDLEELWNALMSRYPLLLQCAYPLALVADSADLHAATRVCGEHSHVCEPRSYVAGSFDIDGANDVAHVFVPTSAAVTASRRFVADTLTAWGEVSIANDASIVISELATNAVLHATSAFSVALTRGTDDVRITVRDVDAQTPISPERDTDTVGGLGLVIVEHLASKWGTELLPDGKAVWCEFVRRD